MQRVIANNYRLRPGSSNGQNGRDEATSYPDAKRFRFNELRIKKQLIIDFKTKFLAIAIFLFHFIEAGTINLIPEKSLLVYRNVRISDLILYCLIAYSLLCYKEYKELFKSPSFRLPLLFLIYILIEFLISFIRYRFSIIEYFFRLKGLWTSFLIFPYMLLLKRDGFIFLIKIIFPVALISNTLYILSALTGIPFLESVSIISYKLPGGFEVFRVFGGTFFGELFFLGFIYYWITRKFKFWQLFPAVLLIIPHVLAFGRMAWAFFVYAILVMVIIDTLRRKNFKVLMRHAILLSTTGIVAIFGFIQFIPESDYYIDALKARIGQGQDDVNYNEGTYGTRVITQNDALIRLWKENDIVLGIGMHPMWVVKPETHEEVVYYSAFCDVMWPSVLAGYGLIGLCLAILIQLYYIYISTRIIKNTPQATLSGFFILFTVARLSFDLVVGFSYVLTTIGLWGFYSINFLIPFAVYQYERLKCQSGMNSDSKTIQKTFNR